MVTGPESAADFEAGAGGWPGAAAAAAPAGGTTLRRSSSESVGADRPARPENSPPAPNRRLTVAATSAARACFRRMTKSWIWAAPCPTPRPPQRQRARWPDPEEARILREFEVLGLDQSLQQFAHACPRHGHRGLQ